MKDFWLYDFTSLTANIENWLQSTFTPFWAVAWEMVIIGIVFLLFYAVTGLLLVYAERRICAFMQNRLGPNRVGPWGLFQTIADFIKLLMKELVKIKEADKFLFNLAPFIVIIASFMAIAAMAMKDAIITMNGARLKRNLSASLILTSSFIRSLIKSAMV